MWGTILLVADCHKNCVMLSFVTFNWELSSLIALFSVVTQNGNFYNLYFPPMRPLSLVILYSILNTRVWSDNIPHNIHASVHQPIYWLLTFGIVVDRPIWPYLLQPHLNDQPRVSTKYASRVVGHRTTCSRTDLAPVRRTPDHFDHDVCIYLNHTVHFLLLDWKKGPVPWPSQSSRWYGV